MVIVQQTKLQTKIRGLILFVIFGLVISGVTAFPIETQLAFGIQFTHVLPQILSNWINLVYTGVSTTNEQYPFISYGTDWLAFAHLVIAVVFIGPLKDPIKNIWVIEFGMIACVMVLPLALIAGSIREIPFFWRLIDCSFGVLGFLPLYVCHRYIKELALLA